MTIHQDWRAFWLLQVAGWGFYGLATFLTFLTSVEPDAWRGLFLFKAVARPVAGVGVSSLLALILRKAESFGGGAVAAATVIGSVVAAMGWYAGSALLAAALRGLPAPTLWPAGPQGLLEYVFVMLAWSASFLGVRAWRRSRERERRALEAEVQATEARLGLLASQLDPHFLFNALSALRGPIRTDPERAEYLVTRLAAFLRSALVQPESREVTLADELATVEAYLDIERARLGDHLKVTTDVEEAALDMRVPVFGLYPLVENAVKYGEPEPGTVVIRGRRDQDRLVLEVSNPGQLAEGKDGTGNGGFAPAGTGVGLSNLRERLALVRPGRHRFDLSEEGGWVHARLEIEPAGNDGA